MDSLEELAREVNSCQKCPLYRTATRGVPGEGPADARVALVGEAPGASEDRAGRPFVGAAGRFLDELLGLAGLQREEVFITNVLKSRPPRNRNPTRPEVEHSLPWLHAQLEVIAPELVVPMGRHALIAFLPGAKISELHGTLIEPGAQQGPAPARRLFALYHPASALHRQELREVLRRDAAELGRVLAALPAADHEA